MRHVYTLQIDLNSSGNDLRVLKKTISKLKQVVNLLDGCTALHRGGFADDIAFVDYWFSSEPTLETNAGYTGNEMVPKVKCRECNGEGEIETEFNPEQVTMECPHCRGSGWNDVR